MISYDFWLGMPRDGRDARRDWDFDHQNLTGAFYVGNGWEGNGIVIDSYCGSCPKIPCV